MTKIVNGVILSSANNGDEVNANNNSEGEEINIWGYKIPRWVFGGLAFGTLHSFK